MNYLQPGLHRDKYRNLAAENFQIWRLILNLIQSSTIWTYEPLPTYGNLLVECHHSNVKIPVMIICDVVVLIWNNQIPAGKVLLTFL